MAGTTEPESPDIEGDRIVSLDKLAETVQDIADKVNKLLSGTSSKPEPEGKPEPGQPAAQTQAQRASGLASEMQQAIEDHERQKQHDATLKDLTDKVSKHEKIFEKPPRQFRKIENLMGWPDRDPAA